MSHSHRGALAAIATLAALGAAAPVAHAEIFATVERMNSSGNLDLVRVNVATGAQATLPASLNTSAHEVHPALSPDGKRIVFARHDVVTGTTRIVMADLATGQTADLFSALEAAADPPSTPVFSADGTKVITGRKLDNRDPAEQGNRPSFTETSVTSFPNGPFPHTIVPIASSSLTSSGGRTLQPNVDGSSGFGVEIDYDSPSALGRVHVRGGSFAGELFDTNAHLGNPAISTEAGVVVYESLPSGNITTLGSRRLASGVTATALPAIVNGAAGASRPAFSADGRYLAFIRGTAAAPRLFVWDTVTQLLLHANGVALGGGGDANARNLWRRDGAVALRVSPVLGSTSVKGDRVTFRLLRDGSVGIIAQRITGTTSVLGRSAPRFGPQIRVPLGRFARGRTTLRWDRDLLKPGRYQLTVRAVTKKAEVRDLGKPVRIRVR